MDDITLITRMRSTLSPQTLLVGVAQQKVWQHRGGLKRDYTMTQQFRSQTHIYSKEWVVREAWRMVLELSLQRCSK